MGRFANLEFDKNEESSGRRETEAPRDERYYVSLATERFRDGRFEDALKFYSRALEFQAQIPEAWLGQVQALLEMEEAHEARVWSDKGLEMFRNQAELLAAKGVALARLGELDTAIAMSDAALAEKGSSSYRWRARGDVLLSRGDRNDDFCFGKALAAAPGDWFEPLAIGRVYLSHDRPAPALRYLEMAASRNGASAFLWETMGGCLARTGMADRARKAYGHAIQIDPQREAAKAALAELDRDGLFGALVRRLSSWFHR